MLRMEEYYRVLHFLKYDTVDRLYPVQEYFIEETDCGELEKKTVKDTSFLFLTNKETFSELDYVEILLKSPVELDANTLTFSMSEYQEGYDPKIIIKGNDKTIPANIPTRVYFEVNKSNQMAETSRNYTGIKSIQLIPEEEIELTLYDISFHTDNAFNTLEQLAMFIENGKYYITSRLHIEEVPLELQDHIYTAAAGYCWLSSWEYEARIMNDEQKNAKSYGKWLFAEVDDAIKNYKSANGISDDDEYFVMTELVHSTNLNW